MSARPVRDVADFLVQRYGIIHAFVKAIEYSITIQAPSPRPKIYWSAVAGAVKKYHWPYTRR